MALLTYIAVVLVDVVLGYALAVVLTGRLVGARGTGVYIRRKDGFFRVHHYYLALFLIGVGVPYSVLLLAFAPFLALAGFVILGLGIGVFLHDAADFVDFARGRKYKNPEDKGQYRKIRVYG